MARARRRKLVYGCVAFLLIYFSSYFSLRPLGKANSWKIPFTESAFISFPVFPLDSGIKIERDPLSLRGLADAAFAPLRTVDKLLTGETIQFSAFELFDMGVGSRF